MNTKPSRSFVPLRAPSCPFVSLRGLFRGRDHGPDRVGVAVYQLRQQVDLFQALAFTAALAGARRFWFFGLRHYSGASA